MWYLAIVVLATIMLYYELYIGGAVSPNIIAGFGMTFPFYVYISVVGNAIGAFGSLLAGLADRVPGRRTGLRPSGVADAQPGRGH